jgi:diguanylate cyclase (GGDEF)-like protein
MSAYGAGMSAIVSRKPAAGRGTGGIVRGPEGLVIVGMAPILPTSRMLDTIVPREGPYKLVFARPFDAGAVAAIGGALGLGDVRFGRPVAPGENSILIRDAVGAPLASVSWSGSGLGATALKAAMPWIVLAILGHLVVAFLIGRRAFARVSALAREALMDSLSKLPNRRALRRELSSRLDRGETLALAMIDLDGFKAINDNYGHSVGDRLIKSVSVMLEEVVGRSSMVARLGGDEFAILVHGHDAVTVLQMRAHDILGKLSRPFRIDERTVLVGASIGLASASHSDLDASELMRRADVAMYAAKRAGKMRLCWYDEMLDQRRTAAILLETELRTAIEEDEFALVYQPVIESESQQIVGVETLLRWESPTRGHVRPAEFVRVAEETGLIDRIGAIVLRKACVEGLSWPINISINLSAAQLRNPDFPSELSRILDSTGFPAERLQLEFNEHFLVADPENARRVLKAIAERGVSLSLDNYGTGTVSMRFLSQFPFSRIKLDRHLVANALHSEAARTALHASIAVARAYGMAVAAEGVETGAQDDLMRVAGCAEVQGWLYARPMSASELASRLHRDSTNPDQRHLRLV